MGPDLGSRRQILAQWPTAARSASPHGTGVTPNHHIAMLQNRLPAGRRGGLTAVFRFIGLTRELRFASPISWLDSAGLDQQIINHGSVEGVAAFGRAPAFSIKDLGDRGEVLASPMEIGSASDEVRISAQ